MAPLRKLSADEAKARDRRRGQPDAPEEARSTSAPGATTSSSATRASREQGPQARGAKLQAEQITRECERRGLVVLELVGEREPANAKGLERPGLAYALERIARREAQGLVVSELARLTHSAAELGTIVEWLVRSKARLVAAAHGLDTEGDDGRLAADLLIEISGWERERLSEQRERGSRRRAAAAARSDVPLSVTTASSASESPACAPRA